MASSRYAVAIFASLLIGSAAQANTRPVHTVPPIQISSKATLAPIDILSANTVFEFDVKTKKATGRASFTFDILEDGFPMFDLVPQATSLYLDNQKIDSDKLAKFNVADDPTIVSYVSSWLLKDSRHTISVTYDLPKEAVSFSSNSVSFASFMSDLGSGGRQFWEQYSPANFEYDQMAQHVELKVLNATTPHIVYTNGVSRSLASNQWSLDFSPTYTTSSYYIHLVPQEKFVSQSFVYQGIEKAIPVTVYAKVQNHVRLGIEQVNRSLQNHEATYGAYLHPSLVVYVTGNFYGGGMEYCGATATDVSAINHELAHMWFARGVMPASGNAGWVDEALATWTDEGFARRTIGERSPVNMSGWSLYRRDTDDKAYTQGAKFIAELDGLFATRGGMRPLLKNFFATYKSHVIETSDFIANLETQTQTALQPYFDRYVFGKNVTVPATSFKFPVDELLQKNSHPYHRPFTKSELKEIL